MKTLYPVAFSLIFTICYSQEKSMRKSKDLIALETEVQKIPLLVKVIKTCSINADLCKNGQAASTSLVMFLEGKYRNQKMYVSALCAETNYKVNAYYSLYLDEKSDTSATFCDGQVYDTDWIFDDFEDKFPVVFGKLVEL